MTGQAPPRGQANAGAGATISAATEDLGALSRQVVCRVLITLKVRGPNDGPLAKTCAFQRLRGPPNGGPGRVAVPPLF